MTEVIKFTEQSSKIIKQIPNFPMEEFVKWWKENYMVVGGGHIVEFIDKKMGKGDSDCK